MNNPPRMVIVANMAAPYSLGRIASHCAHAATMILLHAGSWEGNKYTFEADPDLEYWAKEDRITKIVVKVWGEEALRDLQESAERAGIRTALFTEDDGHTSALALGPSSSPVLDRLTKHLQLL